MSGVVVIDNYDSFAYNLVQYLGELGAHVTVVRNDACDPGGLAAMAPQAIVISPGPGTPGDAGIALDAIRALGQRVPILGVCLGHQCIGAAYGGVVRRGGAPVHGKVSRIHHDGSTIFEDVASPFEATRYHSLIVERASLPRALEVSAELEDGTVMAVRHREFRVEGVQFHPESVLTAPGKQILANFLRIAGLEAGSENRQKLPRFSSPPPSPAVR